MNEDMTLVSSSEQGVLEWLFSGNATAKLLEYLVQTQEFDISAADIAKAAEVSSKTVFRELPKFELLGLVRFTRNVGRAKMYRLNQNSEETKLLTRLVLGLAAKRNESLAKHVGPQQEIVMEESEQTSGENIIENNQFETYGYES